MSRVLFACLTATLLAPCTPTLGQDYALDPTYGTATIKAPESRRVNVPAGGWNDPSRVLGRRCNGWVADAPDFRFRYTPFDGPLTLSVRSEGQTTLLVNDPSGKWHCADRGDVPSLTFETPGEGRYDVWVGYRDRRGADGVIPSTLSIDSSQVGQQASVIVRYDWQMAALTPETRAALEPVVAAARIAGTTVTVEGHADIAEGDGEAWSEAEYLQADPTFARADPDLLTTTSQRRANVVRDHLVARGVSPDAIRVVAHGAGRPSIAGSSPQNRRVEVRVSSGQAGSTGRQGGEVGAGDAAGAEVGATPGWILEIHGLEGGPEHLVNVLCMAADVRLLLDDLRNLSDAEADARMETNARLSDTAVASGLALGFSREEVTDQITGFMTYLTAIGADLQGTRAQCRTG